MLQGNSSKPDAQSKKWLDTSKAEKEFAFKNRPPFEEGLKKTFDHFIKQPLLMEHYLSKFKYQIEFFAEKKQPIVEQAILLWNIIYSVVFQYYEKYKDKWLFIKHEDLSLEPINTFNMIYKKLGLTFNSRIREKIYEYTHTSKSKDNLKRDSKSNILIWKKRLTNDEIKNVIEKTKGISSLFYKEVDWV